MSVSRRAVQVARISDEHPPIDLASVDLTVHDPALIDKRFGCCLDFLARVEREVERNLLELRAILPDPDPLDVRFARDVWGPQEIAHGEVLTAVTGALGRPPVTADVSGVSAQLRVLGALGRWQPLQDVAQMLYYLTGLATERIAIVTYGRLSQELREAGEQGIAETAVDAIRRQEPGHFAYYRLSAEELAARLAPWQRRMVARIRRATVTPVGARTPGQRIEYGRTVLDLGLADSIDPVAAGIEALERRLLRDADEGLPLPGHVRRVLEDAVERCQVALGDRST